MSNIQFNSSHYSTAINPVLHLAKLYQNKSNVYGYDAFYNEDMMMTLSVNHGTISLNLRPSGSLTDAISIELRFVKRDIGEISNIHYYHPKNNKDIQRTFLFKQDDDNEIGFSSIVVPNQIAGTIKLFPIYPSVEEHFQMSLVHPLFEHSEYIGLSDLYTKCSDTISVPYRISIVSENDKVQEEVFDEFIKKAWTITALLSDLREEK